MRIIVNGAWRETEGAELSAVLEELGYGEAGVGTRLAEGDRVEVLAPMQGG